MARARSRDLTKEKFWRRMVGGQARSGLTVRDFCRRHRVPEPGFYWWRRQLALRQAKTGFVPVAIRPEPHTDVTADRPAEKALIEIVLSSDRCIRLHGRVDREALADVLAVLEASSC